MIAISTPSSPSSSGPEAPAHPAQAFASGPLPYRVLVLGRTSLPGVDDGAFADAMALALATRTGHGVDVETVVADVLAAGEVLPGRDLSRIDVVVVALDPQPGSPLAEDAVRAPLQRLSERLTVGAPLVVVVPSARTSALPARELDQLETVVQSAVDALTPVVRLEDAPGTTGDERITRWADGVADAAAAMLIDPMVRFLPDDQYDEYLRVDAVSRVGRSYAEWVDAFQDVVDAARTTYDTPSAALSIIDDETTRYFARSGNVAVSLPRGKTVCNRVMRIFGGLILGDARLDHRFSGLPEVKTGDVRFYAGYRITGPDGAPFGALCVFDREPREVQEEDLTALRDLALDAQRRLWALLPAAPTA